MPYDPQKYHRRSIRLKGYDYAQPGAYFVTMVSYQRENLFGEIVDGEMRVSPLGRIVREEWMRSNAVRREICVNEDEFVIMPNHMHGIVWIVGDGNPLVGADGIRPRGILIAPRGDEGAQDNEGARRAPQPETSLGDGLVGADGICPKDGIRPMDGIRPPQSPTHPNPQPLHRSPRSLSSFVAGFKAAVTSRARRELDLYAIWQRNYYEHIIRNEREFHMIWNYIDTNPQRWLEDQLHPSAASNRFNQE